MLENSLSIDILTEVNVLKKWYVTILRDGDIDVVSLSFTDHWYAVRIV